MDDSSNWSFSQSFTTQFQAMRSELESQIVAAKSTLPPSPDAIQQLSVSLAKANKALADATGSLPMYDQKQYETQIKSFEKSIEELRSSTASKSKFAFKRKAQASGTPTLTPAPEKKLSESPVPSSSIKPASISSHVTLSSHSKRYLTVSDLPDLPDQTDLAISDLEGCIVNLLLTTSRDDSSTKNLVLSALHARNLTNCVILLPIIRGSALLHDLTRCIIILGSHQFRMHSSKNVDVFLHISSNPIIEDCSGIRFTQYPKSFLPVLEQKEQPPLSVQDFSHIRPTPSPNFTIMNDVDVTMVEQNLIAFHADSTSLSRLSDILPQ